MKQSYSNKDLIELTELAKTLWEIDYAQKIIRRKQNVIKKTIPIKAIYRMVKKDRLENEKSRPFDFPFTSSKTKGSDSIVSVE